MGDHGEERNGDDGGRGGGGGGGGEPGNPMLYVGNLPQQEPVEKEELSRLFEKYGEIDRIWVARAPPGFAYVTYVSASAAEEAIRELDGREFFGGPIRVQPKTNDRGGGGPRGGSFGGPRGPMGGGGQPSPYRLELSGLPPSCDWRKVKDWLRDTSGGVRIIYASHIESDGLGHADYATEDDLRRVEEACNGKKFDIEPDWDTPITAKATIVESARDNFRPGPPPGRDNYGPPRGYGGGGYGGGYDDRGPPPRRYDDRGYDDRGPPSRGYDDRGPPPRGYDDRGPPPRGYDDRDRGPPSRGYDDRGPPPREHERDRRYSEDDRDMRR